MSPSDRSFLDHLPQAREFLDEIEPLLPAYRNGSFSYAAVRHNGEWLVLRARLHLDTHAADLLKGHVETSNLCAGQILINNLAPDATENCIRQAITGGPLPSASELLLRLPPKTQASSSSSVDAYHDRRQFRSHMEGVGDRLVLSGIDRHQLVGSRVRELERELLDRGFDSINDLLRVYDLQGTDDTTLEVVATPVAALDQQSHLTGRHVDLAFRLAIGLQADLFNVSVKSADARDTHLPRTLNGAQITWEQRDDHYEGHWELDLPEPQVIDCRVVYAGRPQAELRLADPASLPNPRRMLASLVDPDMSRLEQLLTSPGKKQGQDFEAAFAWLIQVLGFSPIHVSAMSDMKDEPDILATSPAGELLIVECTTAVPDDDKLTLLISRVSRLRDGWRRSQGLQTEANVIAAIACPLPPTELVGIRTKAERNSILILCRPEIENALSRTAFWPDPESVLDYWQRLGLLKIMTGERPLTGY